MLPSEDTVVQALSERLGEDSLAHSRSTAEMAGLLATVYCLDVETARVSALLHDWDRDLSDADLLFSAAEKGLAVTEVDRAVPYLLHARTGAAAVSEAFPEIDGEVVSAISVHTAGDAAMSELAKVLYIADTIEPLREYEGVDALREAVGNVSLHDLFALCYSESLVHLVRSRRPIHPDTLAVWNAQVAGVPR